ncbi:MAG: hypothetical protein LBU26_00550 [Synergistaceae bacterium]|nr:hypothetical protein [Synergistaceae bacterium]
MSVLTKPYGFILAGAKDGFADSIAVLGFHPDLADVLRSLHVLKERPYLSSMAALALSNVVNTIPPQD